MEEYEQLGLFAEEYPQYKIEKPIRLIELFAGIGSQSMAMKRLGVNFESYRTVEFDEFACKAYNSIHSTNFPTIDIRDIHAADLGIVDRDKFEYIMFYSFPCTDISLAGRQAGFSKGSGTRSGLLWEVERILKECGDNLPQVLIMENVPQVHSEKNLPDFEDWIQFLRNKGYSNFYQDLNAKDYGIPQNRDRCFMVSILSDNFIDFNFPKPVKLQKVMRDFLEENVDEKYYIKNEKAQKLIKELIENGTLNRTEQNRTEQRSILYECCQYIPILMGGLGEKVSNGGTQYYFQDRVYSADSVAVSVTAAFNPWYLVKVKNETICSHIENRKK